MGDPQEEAEATVTTTRSSAAKRAKPTEMALQGMGRRNNRCVTVAIPREQNPPPAARLHSLDGEEEACDYRNMETASAACITVSKEVAHRGVAHVSIKCVRPKDEPIVVTVRYLFILESPAKALVLVFSDEDLQAMVAGIEAAYDACVYRCDIGERGPMLTKITEEQRKAIRVKMEVDPQPPPPHSEALQAERVHRGRRAPHGPRESPVRPTA